MLSRNSTTKISRPRRLAEMGALELALCVAQYFYYERDTPIMSDADYDALESYYKSLRKKQAAGVLSNLLDKVGCGDNLMEWLTAWRSAP